VSVEAATDMADWKNARMMEEQRRIKCGNG
jgi:hypothetical protein